MDTRVQSTIATSAEERARALQPLIDEHGAEMDRRREVTRKWSMPWSPRTMLRVRLLGAGAEDSVTDPQKC